MPDLPGPYVTLLLAAAGTLLGACQLAIIALFRALRAEQNASRDEYKELAASAVRANERIANSLEAFVALLNVEADQIMDDASARPLFRRRNDPRRRRQEP